MVMEFKKAERKAAKLRLALCSPAGGGKTFSALKMAKGIGGKIAMIDSEHGSGSLYAGSQGMPDYAVLELDPPFTPKRYIEAIQLAEKSGFDIIIVDSLSHAWAGEGGVLEMHDRATSASRSGNSFVAWREITPEHNRLVDALLQSKCHIIATMRTKQEYTQSADDKGKVTVKKVGMAPVQREGIDYEFTVVLDLTTDHIATSSKDRTSLFDGQHFKPTEETGKQLLEWLTLGKTLSPSTTSTPETSKPGAVKAETGGIAPVEGNPVVPRATPEQVEKLKDLNNKEGMVGAVALKAREWGFTPKYFKDLSEPQAKRLIEEFTETK